jgi:hypothetical protein
MKKLQHGTSSLTVAATMQKKKKKKKKLKNNPRNQSYGRTPSSSSSGATLTQTSSSARGSKRELGFGGREGRGSEGGSESSELCSGPGTLIYGFVFFFFFPGYIVH